VLALVPLGNSKKAQLVNNAKNEPALLGFDILL